MENIKESCVFDASGRERFCAECVTDWSSVALDVLDKAMNQQEMFMIDIRNICKTETGECGCFLRGNPVKYKPRCSNVLERVTNATLLVFVKSESVARKFVLVPAGVYDGKKYVNAVSITKKTEKDETEGSRPTDSVYTIRSNIVRDGPVRIVDKMEAKRFIEYLIGEYDGVVGYEFTAKARVGNKKQYGSMIRGLVDETGLELAKVRDEVYYDLPISFLDANPIIDAHVTLGDEIVWNIVDNISLRIDETVEDTEIEIKITAMSTNVPAFVL